MVANSSMIHWFNRTREIAQKIFTSSPYRPEEAFGAAIKFVNYELVLQERLGIPCPKEGLNEPSDRSNYQRLWEKEFRVRKVMQMP